MTQVAYATSPAGTVLALDATAPYVATVGRLLLAAIFLISGFVIANAYEGRIARFGVLAFLRARVIRLYPMLLLGLLIDTGSLIRADEAERARLTAIGTEAFGNDSE